mgnify:CR=1 FL=1
MDLRDTPGEATLRSEIRGWLEANWRDGMDPNEWFTILADSGWAAPLWPEQYGGRGASASEAIIFNQERQKIGADPPPRGIGVPMAGPTIIQHGTEEQKERFLGPMLRGEEIWCQLFSEPGAGSDLAAIQTRAVLNENVWRVTGQKVWTTHAQLARWGILMARHDPSLPKHAGITYFICDMQADGVEIVPLKEMTGEAIFNEVFLSDARVPHDNVIGDVHRGWGVAVTTLAHERNSLGASGMAGAAGGAIIGRNDLSRRAGAPAGGGGEMAGMAAAFGGGGDLVKTLPAAVGRSDDPILIDKVMRIYTLMEIARFTSLRVQAAAAAGRGPGPEVSTGKLLASQLVAHLRDVGLEALGAHGQLMGDEDPLGGLLQQLALFSPAISIAGGSDQIQRNIIGERVLGLPGEPRVDKDVPFSDLAVGTQR